MKPQTSTERIIAQATLRICSTMVFVSNCMLFLNEFVVYWHPTTREHSDAGYRTNSQSHTKIFSQSGEKRIKYNCQTVVATLKPDTTAPTMDGKNREVVPSSTVGIEREIIAPKPTRR
jgi:hypothetical protein